MATQDEITLIARVMMEKDIDGWKLEKCIGNGANGIVFLVNKNSDKGKKSDKEKNETETAVMKVALSASKSKEFQWESLVMDKILDPRTNQEDRSSHLVRKISHGTTVVQMPAGKETLAYIIMEHLSKNPVEIIGMLTGEEQTRKICDFGAQLLRALHDLHEVGFLHRDVKPENIGMHGEDHLVLFDMGMARAFVDENGQHRPARCRPGIRGTEEWCSLNSELGRDQGRVDDLWGWMYTLNEWANCRTNNPQAWSAYENGDIRKWMKTPFFPLRSVFNNCPFAFYRIAMYLRTLGRCDRPNYFYLASLLAESAPKVKKVYKKTATNTRTVIDEIKFMNNMMF